MWTQTVSGREPYFVQTDCDFFHACVNSTVVLNLRCIRAALDPPGLGAGEGEGATRRVVLGPGLHAARITAMVWLCQSKTT